MGQGSEGRVSLKIAGTIRSRIDSMAAVKVGPSAALVVEEGESPHHFDGLSWWYERKMGDGCSLLDSCRRVGD